MSKENDHFEEILKILYEEDLIGLAGCGCPEDEYACEAARISEAFHLCDTFEGLKTLVNNVFKKYFAEVYNVEEKVLTKASMKIWKIVEHQE